MVSGARAPVVIVGGEADEVFGGQRNVGWPASVPAQVIQRARRRAGTAARALRRALRRCTAALHCGADTAALHCGADTALPGWRCGDPPHGARHRAKRQPGMLTT
jgi:hypothetical protein